MSARREIPAGVLDAALSSLATFGVGIYAARSLAPEVLGAYGLVFTAFLLATRFPAQLVFKPAEIAAVSLPDHLRLGVLARSIPMGALPALLAAGAVALWVLLAPPVDPGAVLALTVTGVFATLISPIQDHVRHMLHLGDASWSAALVSLVQCGSIAAGISMLVLLGTPAPWVPFGALGLANLTSLTVGVFAARGGGWHPPDDASNLRFRELVRAGRWLLLVALIPTGAAFVSAALVVHLAGPAAMGFAEAGRVLGQPPWVLSMGLGAVLGPRSLRAGRAGQVHQARKVSRLFAALLLLLGIPYLLLVGIAWPWSPVPRLLPNAYQVSGLVFFNILGNILIGMDWPYRSELIGAGRASSLARVEAVANSARTLVALAAGQLGAFAIPVGYVVLAVARSLGYRVALRPIYARKPRTGPGPDTVRPDVSMMPADTQGVDL